MKEIRLTRGLVALVDDEDFERVNAFKWHAHYSGRTGKKVYAERTVYYKGGGRDTIRMHRFILGLPPRGRELVVDHRDGDGLNNQKSNLETITQEENMRRAPGWNRKVEEPCL